MTWICWDRSYNTLHRLSGCNKVACRWEPYVGQEFITIRVRNFHIMVSTAFILGSICLTKFTSPVKHIHCWLPTVLWDEGSRNHTELHALIVMNSWLVGWALSKNVTQHRILNSIVQHGNLLRHSPTQWRIHCS